MACSAINVEDYFESRLETMQYVRGMYGVDQPGVLDDAVAILNEWVQKQAHFNKKNFSSCYLEKTIILCKGSIERAKTQLDRICTLRTLLPQFFEKCDAKNDFEVYHRCVRSLFLPKLTDEHYRVFIAKFYDVDWDSAKAIQFYRFNIICAEYCKTYDYLGGLRLIVDFSEGNMISSVRKANPILVRQGLSIMTQGYGLRIKSIHIISDSKLLDVVVTFLKQVLSTKLASRIHFHKCYEEIHEFIPKAVLPKDYGGEDFSIKILHDKWINALSSKEYLNHLQEMNTATTNESNRQKDEFSEQYAGMPGTFRVLSID